MVHKVSEEKPKGFSAKIVGFIKEDPLIKPLFPEEEETEENKKKKDKLVDSLGVDI